MNNKKKNKQQILDDFFFDYKKCKKIKKYYYKKYPIWCCNYKVLPMFNNIGPYEWDKLASEVYKYYKKVYDNKFIIDLVKKVKKNKDKELKIKRNDIYLNELMIYYIQCRPNSKILTLWPKCKETINSIKKLYPNFNIYATKRFRISGKGIESLIYQMYSHNEKYSNYDDIKKYRKKLGWVNKDDYKYLKVIHLEGDTKIKLKNTHITENFVDTIELGKIYFNENSLKFLENQLLKENMSYYFKNCRTIINTYKNFLFSNFKLFDINKFIIFSGAILYSYGIRSCTDLDIFVNNKPLQIFSKNFYDKIKDFFIDDNKYFPCDLFHPKLHWKSFYKDWHKDWGKEFGSENIICTINNPKFHYYFMGLKFMILESDIAKRNLRFRPAAVADLIMINKKLNKNIKIKTIPLKRINYTGEIIVINKKKFLNTIKYWIKKKYGKIVSLEEIKNLVNFK